MQRKNCWLCLIYSIFCFSNFFKDSFILFCFYSIVCRNKILTMVNDFEFFAFFILFCTKNISINLKVFHCLKKILSIFTPIFHYWGVVILIRGSFLAMRVKKIWFNRYELGNTKYKGCIEQNPETLGLCLKNKLSSNRISGYVTSL